MTPILVRLTTAAAAEQLQSELPGTDVDILQRENFDGAAVGCTALLSATITTLPAVLEAIAKVIDSVRELRVADQVIHNPTAKDLQELNNSATPHEKQN